MHNNMTWSQSDLQVKHLNQKQINMLIFIFLYTFLFPPSPSTQPNPIHPIQNFWVQSCMVHAIHHLTSWSFDILPSWSCQMLSMDQVVNLQLPSFQVSCFQISSKHKEGNKQLPPGMMTMPFMAGSNQCCGVTWFFWTRLELPVPENKTRPESGLISGIGSRTRIRIGNFKNQRRGIRFSDSI